MDIRQPGLRGEAWGACYVTLGLQPGATRQEIEASYRRRVSLVDSDQHTDISREVSREARRALSELDRAYQVLSDPQQRRRHDRNAGDTADSLPAHYITLGRAVDVTSEQIHEAYRRRVRLFHPDRHSSAAGDVLEEAHTATAALNRAHDVLSDPIARRRYDRDLGLYTLSRSTSSSSSSAGPSPPGPTYYPQGSSPPPSSRSPYGPTTHHDRPTVSYGPKGPPDPRPSGPSPRGRRSRRRSSQPGRAASTTATGASWLHRGGIVPVMVVSTIVVVSMIMLTVAGITFGP